MLRILIIDRFINPVWDRKWLWLLYLLFWVGSWIFLDSLETLQLLFFLFGLVVFTIPHGASDPYLPAWILNPPLGIASLLLVDRLCVSPFDRGYHACTWRVVHKFWNRPVYRTHYLALG